MAGIYRPRVSADERARADAARADKLAALHERLAEQVAALRTGRDWQRWLAVAARFHTYSLNNTLLILAQRPDATQVAGFDAWKTLGRHVAKGEKGIAILAPILRRQSEPISSAPDGVYSRPSPSVSATAATGIGPMGEEPEDRRIVGYRITYVWDVSQTEGAPLPEQPRPELLHGPSPDGLWDALAALTVAQGYAVSRGDCGAANGLTDVSARSVRIRDDLDDAQAVKTLAHELAHVRLHATIGALPACRGLIEVEAESVAYLVTAAHGLGSGGYTFPYVTGWAQGISGQAPEDVVRATGQRVLAAARWILGNHAAQTLTPERVAAHQELPERAVAGAAITTELRTDAHRALRTAADIADHATSSRTARRDRSASTWRPSTPAAGEDRQVAPEEVLALNRQAAAFFREQLSGSWVPDYLEHRSLGAALDESWLAG